MFSQDVENLEKFHEEMKYSMEKYRRERAVLMSRIYHLAEAVELRFEGLKHQDVMVHRDSIGLSFCDGENKLYLEVPFSAMDYHNVHEWVSINLTPENFVKFDDVEYYAGSTEHPHHQERVH